jgi:CheY-like chemotaxis protein
MGVTVMRLEGASQMTKTVIIAVSDPHILYLLQRYAEESGFQTISASGDKDVLTLLAEQVDPALIILDVESSGSTGPKMGQGLRVETAARRIPVVVYSCLDEPAEEWSEGVADCLPNSVMYDDFVAALKRAGVWLEPAFP